MAIDYKPHIVSSRGHNISTHDEPEVATCAMLYHYHYARLVFCQN